MPMSKESFYLPLKPTLEIIKRYLDTFVPYVDKQPPQDIIDMIGGQSQFDEINEIITQEIEKAKNLYKQMTGENYGL